LLKLGIVQAMAKKEKIDLVKALRKIIAESIRYFQPHDGGRRRTEARLRYEILSMMAFEGASESQIMWDLGFESYTRSVVGGIGEKSSPRFSIRDASEYTATSARSFKRMKHKAIEMIRWKLRKDKKA